MDYRLTSIFEEAAVTLTPERHTALLGARSTLDLCREVSLLLDVFAKSVVAFEAKLYERTFAFGFTPEGLDVQANAKDTRAEISLQVLTVLVAFRAYIEGTEGLLKRMGHTDAKLVQAAFRTAKEDCEAGSFEYRLCWELRNASAHRRPVLHYPASGMQRFWPEGLPSLEAPMLQIFTIDPDVSISELIEEMRTQTSSKGKPKDNSKAAALKEELTALRDGHVVKWIDIKYVLRRLAADIVNLHLSFGKTFMPMVEAADKLIRQEVEAANREVSGSFNTWKIGDEATGEPIFFGNGKPPHHQRHFMQWKHLANLAVAVVNLEVSHRKDTYPLNSEDLFIRNKRL